ncbi:MAG: decaprenyl-phosphate phosphoribosyltransferase [Desulfuromonas sp.]|nr:MAG: decaprenyl-phosphate phosphoribosyltransferase [Desulfuromonas sp.]
MKLLAIIRLLRPHQWLKNLMLFFPPFLGGVLFLPGAFYKGLLPFAVFCMASSATYIFNDIRDREQDRLHPRKQNRPLAGGALPVGFAVVLGSLLLIVSIALSFRLPVAFWGWLMAYLGLSFAYSTVLKDQPVFDIFCIAFGFVFRLFAGGAAFGVTVSDWLFLSVMLLAIFLSAGKRLGEMRLLGDASGDHRRSLDSYPAGSLDGFMYLSGAAVLVTCTMYVITKHKLFFTVPLCCFGLFRYMLVVKRGGSGDPTDTLIKDPVMFLVGLLWVAMVGVATYL